MGVGRTTQTQGLESLALMELTGKERGWAGEHILLEARMPCPRPEPSATTQKDCIRDFSGMDKWGDSALIPSLSSYSTFKVKGRFLVSGCSL